MTMVPPEGTSLFDGLRRVRPDDLEYWSARDLMPFLGYSRWENFLETIEQARAVIAAEQGGEAARSQIGDSTKITRNARGQNRSVADLDLSRYAAYLTAMAGDSRKPEIRSALVYFAVKTREAEVRQPAPALPQDYEEALVHLLGKVRENKQLESRVKELDPSAQAWDVLASADGDFSLRDAAYILNRDEAISTGQNRLLRTIRDFGMVDRNDVPYAKHAAHLVERPTSYSHPRTKEQVLSKQLRVTVQGLRYLHRRLGGEGPPHLGQDAA
ncbi:phage antirepressor KilAC domain-containing protein [Streptomyces sp. NPDC057694]|uniref:phage antirepressor KilAC domain-containing protein n=1 Tax=Streptomyces sp. NPDC057694 TaxID=3346216 RepID=UPI0036BB7B87